MSTKNILSIFVLAISVLISAFLIGDVLAQDVPVGGKLSGIEYPIPELGNCENENACREYCDKPENVKACINFAEKKNLMPREEIEAARKFVAVGSGPGGCKTKESCESFCEDIARINECVSFAEKNDFIPKEKLEEVKKVKAAIDRGVKPPPCKNKNECDVYCENPGNMQECIAFGEAAGFLKGRELEDAHKVLAAINRGIKPPTCRGKEACDVYCNNPNNMEECMIFAEAAGFMQENEREDVKKMLVALKKGVKPPACRGKEECDVYCGEESHFEECIVFAEAAGFMKPEEVEMARKTKGKGPGNCRGKEECETFCNNPTNQEICFQFGKDNGLIPEEELNKMEENKQRFRESFTNTPPEVMECLRAVFGSEMVEKFKNGSTIPPRDVGEKMKECFEKTMGSPGFQCEGDNCSQPPQGQGREGIMMPQQSGPGGCKDPEECKNYCESHEEECKNFKPQMSQPSMRMGGGEMREGIPCEGEECKNIEPPRQMMEIKEFIEGVDPFSRGGEAGREMFEGKEIFDSRELMDRFSPNLMDEQTKQVMQNGPEFYPDTKQQPPMRGDQFVPPQGLQPPQEFQQPQMQPQMQPPQGFSPPTQFSPPQLPPTQPPPPPSPSGIITPQSLLGLIFNIFFVGK